MGKVSYEKGLDEVGCIEFLPPRAFRMQSVLSKRESWTVHRAVTISPD